MKAGLIAFAALSAVAIAQPHQKHQHPKRDVVVTETDVQTAYVTAPAVYVDQYGNRVDGPAEQTPQTQAAPQPSSQPAPQQPSSQKQEAPAPQPTPEQKQPAHSHAAPSSSSPAPVVQSPSPAPVVQSPSPAPVVQSSSSAPAAQSSAPAAVVPSLPAVSLPVSAPSAAPSASSSGSSTGSSGSKYGVTYNALNNDKSCRTAAQVKGDIGILAKDYGIIRTYDNGCDVVSKVLGAIGPHGMKLFAGVADITQVEKLTGDIVSAVGGNWGSIDTIAIGNEGVNNGQYSVKQVSDAVTTARGVLTKGGYTGKVVTVDTFIAIINNPDLCKVGDYVAANCHAFFDGGVVAKDAGKFVVSQAQRVSQACGGAHVVITESGWPWQGSSNKDAVPSKENQAAAVSSLQSSFSSDLFLFNSFNDGWKTDTANTFGAEKYWGIHGDYPSSY